MHLTVTFAVSAPSLAELQQYLVSGLSQGCVYALTALAFVTIANVTGVYNFAQGQWVVFGSFVAVGVHDAGMPTSLVIVLPMLAVGGVALVQERLTVASIRDRAGPLQLVMASLGAGVLLEGVTLAIWGSDQGQRALVPFDAGQFHIFDAIADYQTAWIWAVTALALVGTFWLFRRTYLGRAMRACALNPTASRLVGIPLGRMSMIAFVLGGVLSGLIGAVSVPETGASWDGGFSIGLVGFIAAALAGFENPFGAVAAGLALGVVGGLASGIVSTGYSDAILYGVLIVYLLGRTAVAQEGSIRRLFHRRVTRASRAGLLRSRRDVAQRFARDVGVRQMAITGRRRGRAISARRVAVGVAVVALVILVPAVYSGNPETMNVAIFIALSAIGATGLVLILGLAGQFSLGQGAYYLLSGYTFALLTANAHWAIVPAMLVAIALSVVAGVVLGWLTLGLRGFDLAIATLAFHLILLVIVEQAAFTGGELGVPGVPAFRPFGINLTSTVDFYFVTVACVALALLIAWRLSRSEVGRALRAMATDQDGAESVGVVTSRLKLGVLALGAGMAGLAGCLWASYLQYVTPTSWEFSLMIALLAYVIVGGTGSVFGGVVGAVVVGVLQYATTGGVSTGVGTGAVAPQIILNGGLIVLVIVLLPDGVTSLPDIALRYLTRLRRREPEDQGVAADEDAAATRYASVAPSVEEVQAASTAERDEDPAS